MDMYRVKLFFIISVVLALICIVCASCNTVSPVDTDIIDSARESTTDKSTQLTTEINTTDEITSFASQSIVPWLNPDETVWFEQEIEYILPNYQWMRWQVNIEVCTSVDDPLRIGMRMPQAWLLSSGQDHAPYSENLYGRLYEISPDEKMDKNTISQHILNSILSGIDSEIVGTTDRGLEYIIFRRESFFQRGYDYSCCIRISKHYIWYFSLEGIEQESFDFLTDVLNTVVLTGDFQYSDTPAPAESEQGDVKIMKISNMGVVGYENFGEQSMFDEDLEFIIPESWTLLGEFGRGTTFGLRDAPKYMFAPGTEHCEHPCIQIGTLIKTDENIPIDSKFHYNRNRMIPYYYQYPDNSVSEGKTSGNAPYVFYRTDLKEYHAVEYEVYVRLTNIYVLNFYLCVDSDMENFVYDVLNSINIIEK